MNLSSVPVELGKIYNQNILEDSRDKILILKTKLDSIDLLIVVSLGGKRRTTYNNFIDKGII